MSTAADVATMASAVQGQVVLDCRGVTKRYGSKTVLHDLALELRQGEVFGFLGPNGAGKTTLIKILLGLVTPTAGAIRIFGRDLFSERRRIMADVGAIVEAPMFFEYLTAYENLSRLVSLTGHVPASRIHEVLGLVGLADVAEHRVRTFSYGMKQRLGIAQALLPQNRFVLLDEPTNGLDPHGIAGMRRLIRSLSRDHGVTVFVSSHLLTEIEQICDRVMIINKGLEVLSASVAELSLRSTPRLEIELAESPAVLETATALGARPTDQSARAGCVLLAFESEPDCAPDLVRKLTDAGAAIYSVRSVRPTLEQIFLHQTADGGRDVRGDAF